MVGASSNCMVGLVGTVGAVGAPLDTLPLAQPALFKLIVPPGHFPGSSFVAAVPGRGHVNVIVPHGFTPGMLMQIAV